jgi:cation diffusion facilitator family transporter
VGVFSEGIHSFLDVVSAALSFFTVKEAGKPADEDHPYGHGKIETLSSLFESLLLVLAAGWIIYEAIQHIQNPQPIHYEGAAIGVILLSLAVSYWAYRHNRVAAQEAESSAIHVNALHFLSDVVASLGILIGLVLMKLTGWTLIDPIIAIIVAFYIFGISLKQVKGALLELSDTQLPEEEIQRIWTLIKSFQDKIINAHDLRTRKSGSTRHIDFHLVLCGSISVDASHELCDQMESEILSEFPKASVNIHVEPCEKEQTQCHIQCPHYQKSR